MAQPQPDLALKVRDYGGTSLSQPQPQPRDYGGTSLSQPQPQPQPQPFDSHQSQLQPIDSAGEYKGRDLKDYLPLYKAALKGDWEIAEPLFKEEPDAVYARISTYQRTALHVAAAAGHEQFVMNLVKLMDSKALALIDNYDGDTALHLASIAGITDAAMAMVEKNSDLTQIQNKNGWTPLLQCAVFVAKEQKRMIQYLCTVTRDEAPSGAFSGDFGAQLICNITATGLYALATALDETGCSVLEVLAQKTSSFRSGSRLVGWERRIYSFIPLQVDEKRVHGTDEKRVHSTDEQQIDHLGSRDFSRSRNYLIRDEKRVHGTDEQQIDHLGSRDFSRSRNYLIRDEKRVHGTDEQQIDHLGSRDFSRSWNYLIRAPVFNKVYLTKLEHVQALELLKCICYQISLMTSNEISIFFKNSSILSLATEFEIVEIVFECIQIFPDQIWFLEMERSIFHIAVEQRKEKIFNLMYGMSAQKKILASWRVESGNNILHLAAKIAPSPQLHIVSGAALQMQRELQWFKEVEKIVPPPFKELRNEDRETPRAVFTREHKKLLEKGEKWMKDTSQSCMVVGTLLTTVMFAGVFSVAGGNISDTNSSENGVPIFLREKWFMLFVTSDALGLFSSITSVLMFLSILTSRYAEEDFLKSLPKRLMFGLATLIISLEYLMIAFTASLIIVLSHRISWVVFPVAAVAYLPVALFVLLQSPLLFEIFFSTKYKLD